MYECSGSGEGGEGGEDSDQFHGVDYIESDDQWKTQAVVGSGTVVSQCWVFSKLEEDFVILQLKHIWAFLYATK
ncbi:unnamed protein product, partial [Sphenostylis stenocarpa]